MIELVTSLLAQDRVSPEQAASILQQMLPPDALNTLQARLNTPRGSMEDVRCYRWAQAAAGGRLGRHSWPTVRGAWLAG